MAAVQPLAAASDAAGQAAPADDGRGDGELERIAGEAHSAAPALIDALALEARVPLLHIADATLDAMSAGGRLPQAVGLIATKGTIAAGFFQQRLASRGVTCILNSEEEQDALVLPAIHHVKRHALASAHALAVQACERLIARGAETIILGCTEIPPALEYQSHSLSARCVDPTRALAQACVAWWRQESGQALK